MININYQLWININSQTNSEPSQKFYFRCWCFSQALNLNWNKRSCVQIVITTSITRIFHERHISNFLSQQSSGFSILNLLVKKCIALGLNSLIIPPHNRNGIIKWKHFEILSMNKNFGSYNNMSWLKKVARFFVKRRKHIQKPVKYLIWCVLWK